MLTHYYRPDSHYPCCRRLKCGCWSPLLFMDSVARIMAFSKFLFMFSEVSKLVVV
jgi:hypothetical protein